jgi:hypothetical protein
MMPGTFTARIRSSVASAAAGLAYTIRAGSAAKEASTSAFHRFARSDYRPDRIAVAQRFGKNGDVRINVQPQVSAARMQPPAYRDFVENKQTAGPMRFIAHIFQKARLRILITAGLHYNRSEPVTVPADQLIERLLVIGTNRNGRLAKLTRHACRA